MRHYKVWLVVTRTALLTVIHAGLFICQVCALSNVCFTCDTIPCFWSCMCNMGQQYFVLAAMPEMPRMPTMDLKWRDTDFAGLERLDPDILPDM